MRAAYGEAQRRGAAPPPLRGQQRLPRAARGRRAGVLRHLAGQQPGRVRRAAGRRTPLLRGHPGPPRAALAADPAAPAVRRAGRGGDPAAARAADPDRRERAAAPLGGRRTTTSSSRRPESVPTGRDLSPGSPTSRTPGPCSAPGTSTATTGWWRCARTSYSVPATPTRPSAGSWSSTRARSSCSPSTTTSASAASGSTATPAAPCSSSFPPGSSTRRARTRSSPRPASCARRWSCRPSDWRRLLTLYPSAGITDELHHLYLARGLSHADRGDFELRAEEAELEVVWVPFEELLDAVLDGRVREGPLAAARPGLRRPRSGRLDPRHTLSRA